MGKMQKRKGYRTEKMIETILKANHLDVIRVPLSGATSFQKGDLLLKTHGQEYLIEVKSRKDGFEKIISELFRNDGVWFETQDAF